MHALYLIIDILSILFPLIFSFHPQSRFYRKWPALLPAIFVTAIYFVLWDVWFTSMGVWGFNPDYLIGMYLFNLPLEEVLFFICVPYSCVFIYDLTRSSDKFDEVSKKISWITPVLVLILVVTGIIFREKWYTMVTLLSLAFLLAVLRWVANVRWLTKFLIAYCFILIPFFIVNGILTGTGLSAPVVWYNNEENAGLRLGTIPAEDIFYGMLLILLDVTFYELFLRRTKTTNPVSSA